MNKPKAAERPTAQQAVVIGGSIAGLLAAQHLAAHFAQVTIVERDLLPRDPLLRPGVAHAALSHGVEGLLRTLDGKPWLGLRNELLGAGALVVDTARDFCWLAPPQTPRPAQMLPSWLSCSRALLEWTIRQCVTALPNVQVIEAVDVIGLTMLPEDGIVNGLELRQRKAQSTTHNLHWLTADLVVDASGRHSKAHQWLAALDCPVPNETVLRNQPYWVSSCVGAMPTGFADGWKWLSLHPDNPADGWSVGVQQIEGERWLVFITMGQDKHPPTTQPEFIACLQSLEHPLLSPWFEQVQWLTRVVGGGHTNNRWRHYEQLTRQPDNFIALGDAVCVLHPGYGAGMKIAAKEALVLDACLQEQRNTYPVGDLTGFAQRFQQRIAPIIAQQWAIETA